MTQYFLVYHCVQLNYKVFLCGRPIVKSIAPLALQISTPSSIQNNRDTVCSKTFWGGVLRNEQMVTNTAGMETEPVACTSHVPEDRTSIWQERKPENHTQYPPPRPLFSTPSLCVCGCVSEDKQCCPTEPEYYRHGGSKKGGAWKERAGVVFRPYSLLLLNVCGKTLWGAQTRHSFTHGHYTTPGAQRPCRLHRVRREGWGRLNRGTFQTEEG